MVILFLSLYGLRFSKTPAMKIKLVGKGMYCNAEPNILYVFLLVISQGFRQISGEALHFS